MIVVETDGIQHFQFCSVFHKTIESFHKQQARDKRKIELCEELRYSMLMIDDQRL